MHLLSLKVLYQYERDGNYWLAILLLLYKGKKKSVGHILMSTASF